MQKTVTQNRADYLGGSDIPALLGISKYKTRYQLLKEKAHICEIKPVFANAAINFGNALEPKIRDYLNEGRDLTEKFLEWKFERSLDIVRGTPLKARGHLDGFDASNRCCLEIKTTSETRGDDVRDYPDYLYQMLFYMDIPSPKIKSGILAVYVRPDDYNETFDETRLHIFRFELSEMKAEIKHLRAEIRRFLEDLAEIMANPEKAEADLIGGELAATSSKIIAFEQAIAELKEKESQLKELKEELTVQMVEHGVKSFDAGGYQITLIEGTPETVETVKVCDVEALELFYPDVAEVCLKETEKKKAGRAASVRVTKRKGAENDE